MPDHTLDLGPYWVDRLTPADHDARDPETLQPRPKRRSGSAAAMQESRVRGARSIGKRKLPELLLGDDEP